MGSERGADVSKEVSATRRVQAAKALVAVMIGEGAFIAGMGAASAKDTLREAIASVLRNPSLPNIITNGMAAGVDAVLIGGGAVMAYKGYQHFKELGRLTGSAHS